MSDNRYVTQSNRSKVYLIQVFDGNANETYYGPYFDKKVAQRIVTGWKNKRASGRMVAMHILESDVDWKEADG